MKPEWRQGEAWRRLREARRGRDEGKGGEMKGEGKGGMEVEGESIS